MKYTHLIIFALALLVSSPAYGQKYLQKPYTEWSVEDVQKVLKDSPWSLEYQSPEGNAAAALQQQAREQADTRLSGADRGNQGRGAIPAPVVMRLHSAAPVRQAMVRSQQINAKYDKMSAEDKKKFDESTAKFLACAICTDYYVVTLTKYKDSSGRVDDGIFQTLTSENLKGKVWLLNDRDEKLELAEFTPPKGAGDPAVFFFKRPATPFFNLTDKQIRFMFANELRQSGNNAYASLIPRTFEFKVSKMVVGEKIEF